MDNLEGAYWSPVTQLYSVVCARPKIVYVVILLIVLEECAIIVSWVWFVFLNIPLQHTSMLDAALAHQLGKVKLPGHHRSRRHKQPSDIDTLGLFVLLGNGANKCSNFIDHNEHFLKKLKCFWVFLCERVLAYLVIFLIYSTFCSINDRKVNIQLQMSFTWCAI